MFGRKTPTAVGPQTVFRGALVCGDDDLVVAGRIEGTITSEAAVTVVEGGVVTGDVTARVVIVGGRIEGTVVARERLRMRPTGHIQGDARYGSLEVDRGGVIDGHTSALHPGRPALEAAVITPAPSVVEETMRFTTPLAAQVLVDDGSIDEERGAPVSSVPASGRRTTAPWDSEDPNENEPAAEG